MFPENKQEPNENFISTDYFNNLKEIFKEEINSERIFEDISTVEELVSVLEDRVALTHDVLSNLEPDFRDFVRSRRINSIDSVEILPKNVVRLFEENFQNDWKEFGAYLLTNDQLCRCCCLEDVLSCFTENCKGISKREMIFRLTQSVEKCQKGNLKSKIVELMTESKS